MIRTPEVPSRVRYQKKPSQIACFTTAFQPHFPNNEQEVCQCSQWKVCSGAMSSLLSWLHGRHQSPFLASKFKVLLAILFGFLVGET